MNLTNEQKALITATREFALKEIALYAARWDQEEHVPRSHVQKLADAGFLGMTMPEQYGGKGYSSFEAVLIIGEVARHCAVSARLLVDHNFGAVGTILNFGTEEQRQRVLPAITSGEKLISIGMTEPETGSALTDLTTSVRAEGKWLLLNGRKRWITGAGEREYTLVYARFNDIPGAAGIGALLVEQGMDGYRPGERIPSLGVRGLREGELIFENVPVPQANLVMPPGSAFGRLMSAYNGQRVGASAAALGIAQGAFDYALDYVEKRQQFGRRLSDFQTVQFKLADMTIDIEAARALLYQAAATGKATLTSRYESSLAKTYCAEMAIRVTNMAVQLMGAEGYGRHHPLERMLRDARMFTIAGGTTEMQRLGIAGHILGRPLPQDR